MSPPKCCSSSFSSNDPTTSLVVQARNQESLLTPSFPLAPVPNLSSILVNFESNNSSLYPSPDYHQVTNTFLAGLCALTSGNPHLTLPHSTLQTIVRTIF